MFKTYSIKDGLWYAEIASDIGANVSLLQYDGREVLVPLKSLEQLKVNPYIQGAPLLLPANRTAEGRFSFEGRDYSLVVNEPLNGAHLHGLLHKCKFDVCHTSQSSICLKYENKGDIYPFPFEFYVTYSVSENGFRSSYVIKNTGICKMPITFALHTTFVEPKTFTVPIDMCQQKDEKHIPTGRYVELNSQERLYPTGCASKDMFISGYYRSCGSTAKIGDFTYTVSDEFDHWILFNGAGKKGLLCVEPQCGAVNGLNIKGGYKVIEPDSEIMLNTLISRNLY